MTRILNDALVFDRDASRFRALIGVGGIGSGSFFLLNGDHTLGREESRSGRFIDKDDYCKLHIIAHYVKVLLGTGFDVVPIGRVGKDPVGKKLIAEMENVGLDVDYVKIDELRHTLYSFCFLYPDHSGGNLTTDDSACSAVGAADVAHADTAFQRFAGQGIALAAPEVPLEARAALLDRATRHDFFRVASFTAGEMSSVMSSGILRNIDLLCINLEEAATALGMTAGSVDPLRLAGDAAKAFASVNPGILTAITHGKHGSYVWDGADLCFAPALPVTVVSTAGAGDAFTAGFIAGIVAGLSLRESQFLATVTGACSVTSPHTINMDLGRASLLDIARANHDVIPHAVMKLLEVTT